MTSKLKFKLRKCSVQKDVYSLHERKKIYIIDNNGHPSASKPNVLVMKGLLGDLTNLFCWGICLIFLVMKALLGDLPNFF